MTAVKSWILSALLLLAPLLVASGGGIAFAADGQGGAAPAPCKDATANGPYLLGPPEVTPMAAPSGGLLKINLETDGWNGATEVQVEVVDRNGNAYDQGGQPFGRGNLVLQGGSIWIGAIPLSPAIPQGEYALRFHLFDSQGYANVYESDAQGGGKYVYRQVNVLTNTTAACISAIGVARLDVPNGHLALGGSGVPILPSIP